MQRHKDKRRRGVILALQGFQKLQTAKSQAEFFENCGNRYTLEDIVHLQRRERTTVSCQFSAQYLRARIRMIA